VATNWQKLAHQVAVGAHINPKYFVRQIAAESGFNPNARSPAGAVGIAQFMPATAAGLGIDPSNPYQSLKGAAHLMARYLSSYHGDWHKALAAYNAGVGNVPHWQSIPETRAYVAKILGGGSIPGLGTQQFTGQNPHFGMMPQHGKQTRFIHDLRSALGTPYQWGGTSLQNGVDCSGLIYTAARLAGIKGVPRTSQQQYATGRPVGMGQLRPGDLVFSNWGNEQGAGHVSVYIGNGKIIEAARPGTPVSIKPLSVLNGHVLGARRILANPAGHVVKAADFPGGGGQGQGNVAAAALAAYHPYNPVLPDRSATPTAQQNVNQFLLAHQPKPNAGLQALQNLSPAQQNPYQQALTPQLQQQTAQTGLEDLHQRLLKPRGLPSPL